MWIWCLCGYTLCICIWKYMYKWISIATCTFKNSSNLIMKSIQIIAFFHLVDASFSYCCKKTSDVCDFLLGQSRYSKHFCNLPLSVITCCTHILGQPSVFIMVDNLPAGIPSLQIVSSMDKGHWSTDEDWTKLIQDGKFCDDNISIFQTPIYTVQTLEQVGSNQHNFCKHWLLHSAEFSKTNMKSLFKIEGIFSWQIYHLITQTNESTKQASAQKH